MGQGDKDRYAVTSPLSTGHSEMDSFPENRKVQLKKKKTWKKGTKY
jgi:hypothetical protein